MSEIILEYTRAGHVENIHRADVVAVNCKGDILKEAGTAAEPGAGKLRRPAGHTAAIMGQLLPLVRCRRAQAGKSGRAGAAV